MPDTPLELSPQHDGTIQRLFVQAGAAKWGVTEGALADALRRSCRHRFRDLQPSASEIDAYLKTLHIEDLALVCGCLAANESAWEAFVLRFRPELYAAARAIAGEGGRDLADGLYADLFGLGEGETRRSLFLYFHGRSRLGTWLRSILAQRHVDAWRATRNLTALPDEPVADRGAGSGREPHAPPDPDRSNYLAHLEWALGLALGALAPRDRLRLSSNYVQQLPLAQIGRVLGEHEATVSRKLDRTRRDVRQRVEKALGEERGLAPPQIRLCFDYALEDWGFDLARALPGDGSHALQETVVGSFSTMTPKKRGD
jgi:RNA polymerase sigma factor (sigma-70 family)